MNVRAWVLGCALLLASACGSFAQEVPAACAPEGALDYYQCRADDFVRRYPDRSPPDYYLDYGDRYVNRFSEETEPLLSPAGKAWLARVRRALQVRMEQERARDPFAFGELELDPIRFLDFAYDTHPEAYLDAGLSELPLRDQIVIATTPDARDLLSDRGRAQIERVLQGLLASCRDEGVVVCLLTRSLRELRERRRLMSERLGLRPSGSLGRWLARRLIGSLARELEEARAPKPGAAGALGAAGS